ncbi:MAG: hypothetical protein ABIF85_01680 [Nanoarchaeota archaeon]|nr:hypothetical protein [Nanoarchaeota archaeon]MBU4299608.1 hypothetical protein [Nanoarchaeota archaeon]MBU4451871.1 hypothetical protein [Nanoarchaeota archaeon]MCG2723935.1 hypothetical protein [archaeon]
MTTFKTPSWPVCKVALNGDVKAYVGFSKETALGIGNDPITGGNQSQKNYVFLEQYNSHIPVYELDTLDGQKIESGPGYLLDAEALKKYLEESCEDIVDILQNFGGKMNSEKVSELKENLKSYEDAYMEIFGLEIPAE